MALVVAAAVVIVGGVIGVILLLGGGDDGSEPSTASPLGTAESFAQSWNATDVGALKSLMTDDLRPFAHFDRYDMEQIELESPEVVDETDARAVAVIEGGDNTYELLLVEQNGEWLIKELNVQMP